jgi:hypothetical protein
LFSGPHIIQKLIGKTNAQLKLKNGRTTIVHLNRIKPFLSQSDKIIQHQKEAAQEVNLHPEIDEEEENLPTPQNFFGHPRNILPTLATTPSVTLEEAGTAKRKRGRPPKPKIGRAAVEERHMATPPQQDPPTPEGAPAHPVTRVTRSQLQQMTDEQKAEYFVKISFIDALKQLTSELFSVKNKKSVKNKRVKNGSSNDKWSTLQKAYFKKFGDTYGETVTGNPRVDYGDIGAGNESDSESSSDNDSQPGSEHPDSEHSDDDPGEESSTSGQESLSEHEDDGNQKPPSTSDSADEFVDAKEAPQAQNEAGHGKPKEQMQEDANKVAEERPQVPDGKLPPLQKAKLPIIQRPQQPQPTGHAMAPKGQDKVPKPAVPLHSTQTLPPRTSTNSQNTVPSSTIYTKPADKRKDDTVSHANPPSGQGTKGTTVLKMGSSSTSKTETVHKEPLRTTGSATGTTSKPSVTTERLIKPIQPPNKKIEPKPSDIGLMARILGLAPSGITKETGQELVGELINRGATNAVSPLAPQGSHSGSTLATQQQVPSRPQSPDPASTIKWAAYRNEEKAKKEIQERKSLEKEQPPPRPTRSNFTAKPILAPPKLSLERQIQKQLKEDKVKNKLDDLEKSLLEQEKKDKKK